VIHYAIYTTAEVPKNCPFQWGIFLPSNRWFLGPTSQPPNGISIDSAVYAQYISVPNKQTDTQTMLRATSVAIGHIYHHHHDYRSYRCSLHFSLALDTFRKDDHPEVSRDSYSLALVTVWIHNYAAANHRMT